MNRVFKILIVLLIIIALVLTSGYIYLLVKGKDLIVDRLEKQLGKRVSFSSVSISYPLTIKIDQLKVEGYGTARQALFSLSLPYLLFRQVHFVQIEIIEPNFIINRQKGEKVSWIPFSTTSQSPQAPLEISRRDTPFLTGQAPAASQSSEAPAASQSSEVPATPQAPEVVTAPQSSEVSTAPQSPEAPAASQSSEAPAVAPTPEASVAPESPETATAPQSSEAPAAPQSPETATAAQSSEVPATPQAPEVVTAPQAPEVVTAPQSPEVPATPQTSEVMIAPQSPQVSVAPDQAQAKKEKNSAFDTFDGAKPRPEERGLNAPLSINPEQASGIGSRRVEWVDFFARKIIIRNGNFQVSETSGNETKTIFSLKNMNAEFYHVAFPIKKPLKTEFNFKGALSGFEGRLSSEQLTFSGWADFYKKDMLAKAQLTGMNGQVGLDADLASKQNDMTIKGKMSLDFQAKTTPVEGKAKTFEDFFIRTLQTSGVSVNLKFQFKTKMDDFKVGQISISGEINKDSEE